MGVERLPKSSKKVIFSAYSWAMWTFKKNFWIFKTFQREDLTFGFAHARNHEKIDKYLIWPIKKYWYLGSVKVIIALTNISRDYQTREFRNISNMNWWCLGQHKTPTKTQRSNKTTGITMLKKFWKHTSIPLYSFPALNVKHIWFDTIVPLDIIS